MSKPTFKLFKSTSSANHCQYVGSVTTPDGQIFAIEANVSEHDKGDGTKGKHFEGKVFPAGHFRKQMLRGAKANGKLALPPDLVELMEPPPFDDPLPENL